jgi:tetratricopeptide (TPR) repeat protein
LAKSTGWQPFLRQDKPELLRLARCSAADRVRAVKSFAIMIWVAAFGLPLIAAERGTELRARLSDWQSTSGDPQAMFDRGESLLRDGELGKAESEFRAVLAIDPRVAGAYANLGVIEMRRKHWAEALADLRKAEKLAPDVAGIRLNIGLVYFHQEDYRAAIAPFASVVREEPDSRQARYLLGLCDFLTEQYADATEELEPLWEAENNNLSFLYVLGIAAGQAKRGEVEERALNRLIAVGGDTPEFHLLMGKAELNRGEDAKAEAELGKAAVADTKLPFVHLYLGIADERMSKQEEARAEFEKEIALEPDVAYGYDEMGALCAVEHDDAKAAKYFREALARNARLASAQFGLGDVLQRAGKNREALAALDAAEKLAPESRYVRYLRGKVLKRLGREAEARKEFAEAGRLEALGLARDQEILRQKVTPEPELKKAEE